MPEVKIFMTVDRSYSYDDYEQVLSHGVSDWETITDEEFEFLRTNLNRLKNKYSRVHYGDWIIIRKPDFEVKEAIVSIKEELEIVMAEEQKRKDEAARKKATAAAKKAQTVKDKELEQLKQLQEKYKDNLK